MEGRGVIPQIDTIDLGAIIRDVEEIKAMRTDREIRETAIQQQRETIEARRAYLSGDDSAMGRLMAMAPDHAVGLLDALDKLDGSGREQRRQVAAEVGGAAAYVLRGGDPAEQERRYLAVRAQASPEMQAVMPESYDPDWVQMRMVEALGATEYIERMDAIDARREGHANTLAEIEARGENQVRAVEARGENTLAAIEKRTEGQLAVEGERTEGRLAVEAERGEQRRLTEAERAASARDLEVLRNEGRVQVATINGETRITISREKGLTDSGLDTSASNSIRATVLSQFGGFYDPTTDSFTISDPDSLGRALRVMAEAEKILAAGDALGVAQAVEQAMAIVAASVGTTDGEGEDEAPAAAPAAGSAPPAAEADGAVLARPNKGDVVDGYRFIGGPSDNVNDPAMWEKVQQKGRRK